MRPWVGAVVHYVSHGSPIREDGTQAHPSTCRAAIVTKVEDPAGDAGGGIVSLSVLNPEGMFFNQGVSHVDAEHRLGGTWHWPHWAEGGHVVIDAAGFDARVEAVAKRLLDQARRTELIRRRR